MNRIELLLNEKLPMLRTTGSVGYLNGEEA